MEKPSRYLFYSTVSGTRCNNCESGEIELKNQGSMLGFVGLGELTRERKGNRER